MQCCRRAGRLLLQQQIRRSPSEVLVYCSAKAFRNLPEAMAPINPTKMQVRVACLPTESFCRHSWTAHLCWLLLVLFRQWRLTLLPAVRCPQIMTHYLAIRLRRAHRTVGRSTRIHSRNCKPPRLPQTVSLTLLTHVKTDLSSSCLFRSKPARAAASGGFRAEAFRLSCGNTETKKGKVARSVGMPSSS